MASRLFFLPEEPVRAFTGDGVLTSALGNGLGILEHVALVPVTGMVFSTSTSPNLRSSSQIHNAAQPQLNTPAGFNAEDAEDAEDAEKACLCIKKNLLSKKRSHGIALESARRNTCLILTSNSETSTRHFREFPYLPASDIRRMQLRGAGLLL